MYEINLTQNLNEIIMKKMKFILLIFFMELSCFITTSAQTNCKEIVGYYPNWQWYDRSKLVRPQTINYSKYSILNYCFFKPEVNGSISSTDTWADENLLLGQINWSTTPVSYYPNTSIVDLAHQNNVKILPSIGGWTLSDNFPSIAADPIKRSTFAQACVNLIETYNFDGIDLDWEYPGFAEHNGTPQDKQNFTLLLQAVRNALNNYGNLHNKTLLLTIAVSADEAKMENVEWQNIVNTVDIINLMSYDFFGAWDSAANHNSPLFAPTQGNTKFNTDYAVQKLMNDYQIPANKITLGVAFYGRSMKTNGNPDLYSSTTGSSDMSTFTEDEGTPLFYNVKKKENLFNYNWDDVAKVPYLTGKNSLNTFVSYDNELSIAKKAEYIVDQNLRGAIIWEITGDYIESITNPGTVLKTPLVDTLNYIFCNYSSNNPSTEITIINSPSNTTIQCGTSTSTSVTGEISATTTCNGGILNSTFVDVEIPGICEDTYTLNRTWTITDACGNTSSYTQQIQVIDNIAPTLTLTPLNETIQSNSVVYLDNYLPDVVSTDNCGDVLLTQEPAEGIALNVGQNNIVFTATDDCGNASTITKVITVVQTGSLSENKENEFQIFPNPVHGKFKIKLNEVETILIIKDVNGKEIITPIIQNEYEIEIDTQSWSKGVYYVQLTSNNNSSISKVVVN